MSKALTATVGILAAISLTCVAIAQKAEDAVGIWLNPENGSHIQFYMCGDGRLCGKIVKVKDSQKSDDNNPDWATLGLVIVGAADPGQGAAEGLRRTDDNRWAGRLFKHANGKRYMGTVTAESKDTLKLLGCFDAVFCITVSWTRVR